MKNIYHHISTFASHNKKMFGVLIDPDKQNAAQLLETVSHCEQNSVDYIFVGGSIITKGDLNQTCRLIKENCSIPVILFPGSPDQLSRYADAILFLSLISGRNPKYLIESHVAATPTLSKLDLEIIPTGYLLVDCGTKTTAIYVSDTNPIPHDNAEIAATTALAGEYLGLKLTYIDGGSGAKKCISTDMISATKNKLSGPLIIGGGIRSAESAEKIYSAGADLIIVGNGIEEKRQLIKEIAAVKSSHNVLIDSVKGV